MRFPLKLPKISLFLATLTLARGASFADPPSPKTGYVQSQGTHFTLNGGRLQLYGFTFYPSPVGGSSAWRKEGFTRYIDHILALAGQAGQNMARPTDYWNKNDPVQAFDDPVIWKNMDYLIAQEKKRGGFVLMDLSAYGKLLTAKGQDPHLAANWTPFLRWVAARYLNEPTIAFYSIIGEPDPPQTPEEAKALVDFYKAVMEELRKADQGRHLIAAGGFNHMKDEKPSAPWWHPIYALPSCDVVTFKTYSRNDIGIISLIAEYAEKMGKPACLQEFGMPQYLGDGKFSGKSYNHIEGSRADFYGEVYREGKKAGVESFVFWNLGCEMKDKSYEVSPRTPAVWKVIRDNSPFPSAPAGDPAAACP